MTVAELDKKRSEYWETAPSYGGRKEMWDAIRAAATQSDVAMQEAIVASAGLFLPNGDLTLVYDERGFRYEIPLFCLSPPSNITSEEKRPESPAGGDLGNFTLLLRISYGEDIKFIGPSTSTVADVKRFLARKGTDESRQRIFYQGRQLNDDA